MKFKNLCFLFLLCIYVYSSNSYSARRKGDLFMSYDIPTPGAVLVSCAYCSDNRQPAMEVGEQAKSNEIKVNTYVSNAYDAYGRCYLVTTQLLLLDSMLPHQTTFECILKDALTGVVKNTSMVYVQSSARKTMSVAFLPLVMLILDVLLHRWSEAFF